LIELFPELNKSYDAILGMPYLENADPDISFSNKTFNWRSNDSTLHSNSQPFNAASIKLYHTPVQSKCQKKLSDPIRCRSKRNKVILGGIEVDRKFLNPYVKFESSDKFVIANVWDLAAHPEPAPEANVQFNEISVDEVIPTLHPEGQKLIKQFGSVFPDELPKKLPPKREIEHRIDLIPGSKPASQQVYRMSDYELKELKRQIDDLLAHGFIRSSLSPYVAPVLFVKKKDGSMRLCIDSTQFVLRSFTYERRISIVVLFVRSDCPLLSG